MIEHDIQIRATYNQTTNSYSYSVKYLFEGDVDDTSLKESYPEGYTIPRYTTAYSTDDKYIQSYVQNYNKDISILLFKIDLVQISKESTTYPIVKNDIISLTGLDFPFSNELSHFNIFYRKNCNSSWENILAVPIYQSDDIYNEDVIFYETLHDEKKIRLTMSDFVPAYNSELRIDIYNTMGSEVNGLIYSGNGSDISISLNTFDERHSYTGLELNCKPISGAYGGLNTPTLEELRAKVITAKSTVNSIDTDYDLINFMRDKDSTNDCVFVKKRNDIIERRYSCFMIPRLIKKDIIPTSTLDLCIPNFKSTVDREKHNYYEFKQATDNERYNDPLYYALQTGGFRGNFDNTNIDNKGESDEGAIFYSIGESYYQNLLNTHISDILIATSYNTYSINNITYTKSNQYISLKKYLADLSNMVDDNTTLQDILDENLSFNNPLEKTLSLAQYNIKYSESVSPQNKLVYDLELKRFVADQCKDTYNGKILNKYKLKGSLFTCEQDTNGIYVLDNLSNGYEQYYYNPLETYGKDRLYIAIEDLDGAYIMILTDDTGDEKYVKWTDNTIGNKYRIVSLNSLDNEYIYDLSKSNIVTYNKDGISKEYTLLSKNNEFDNEEFISPFYNLTKYTFNEIYLDNNNPTLYTEYTNNNSYYYKVYNLNNNNNTIFIQLKEYLDDNGSPTLNSYMIGELAPYVASEASDGSYILNSVDDINGERKTYYYKYMESVTIKDIPLYVAINKVKSYSKIHEDKYRYYLQNIDELNPETYIYKKLYYRETKNMLDDLGSYIYDYKQNIYIKEVDEYSISGIVFSVDANGNKENISIKAGTPLLLKKDIEKFNGLGDTQFNNTLPSYQYPLLSIKEFYTNNNYTYEGSIFNTNNSLMVLNMNEKITVNGESISKYMVDKDRGLYWSKDGVSLESIMKVYTLPYTIVYNIQNQMASFFLTSISKDVNMNMIEEMPNKSVNFSIDTIHIERNSALENDSIYNISVTVMTNGDISNAKINNETDGITQTNIHQTANSIMLKGFIYDNTNTLRGYFNLDYDTTISHSTEDMFTFTGEIKISDSVSSTHFTNMKNMYAINGLNCEISDTSESFIEYDTEYYLPDSIKVEDDFLNLKIEDLRIAIGCYYLDRLNGTGYNMSDVSYITSSEVKPILDSIDDKHIYMNKVGNGILNYPQFAVKSNYTMKDGTSINTIDKYILTNVYDNSMDLIDIYTDMSNFVKSAVQINELTKNVEGNNINSLEMLHFTDIPVIQFSQCLSNTISDRITNVISDTNKNLSDLSAQITNNFSIDYKFFRTYGPCRYFKLRAIKQIKDNENNEIKYVDENIDLGNLDITIRFNLLIKTNLSISDNEVVSQLKTYIKNRIEELNNETDNDDYTIYISNIITDIENEFNDYIRSIELVSINGNDSSYRIIGYNKPNFEDIEYYNSSTNTEDIKEYIPEYINVPLNNIIIDIRR